MEPLNRKMKFNPLIKMALKWPMVAFKADVELAVSGFLFKHSIIIFLSFSSLIEQKENLLSKC